MENKYKLKWTKILLLVIPLTIYLLGLCFTVSMYLNDPGFLLGAILFSMLFAFFVVLYVHLLVSYYNHDANAELVVNTESNSLKYSNKGESYQVSFANIKSITVNRTYYAAKGSAFMSPADFFFYFDVRIDNGDRFIITNLLCSDLKFGLDAITKTEIRKIPLLRKRTQKSR